MMIVKLVSLRYSPPIKTIEEPDGPDPYFKYLMTDYVEPYWVSALEILSS